MNAGDAAAVGARQASVCIFNPMHVCNTHYTAGRDERGKIDISLVSDDDDDDPGVLRQATVPLAHQSVPRAALNGTHVERCIRVTVA